MIWNRLTVGIMALLALFIPACQYQNNLSERVGAGVLTDSNGTMFLVLTPCHQIIVDSISLNYKKPGATPGDASQDVTVLSYVAPDGLVPSQALAPLDPDGSIPPGLELVEVNRTLLAQALVSKRSNTYGDRFYVEVRGRFEDGSIERIRGTWAADMSARDTVVLRSETFDDPSARHCGADRTSWSLPT